MFLYLYLLDLYAFLAGARIGAFILEVIIIATIVFAIIGLISTIRFFVRRRRNKKMTPGEKWLKTGRIN